MPDTTTTPLGDSAYRITNILTEEEVQALQEYQDAMTMREQVAAYIANLKETNPMLAFILINLYKRIRYLEEGRPHDVD